MTRDITVNIVEAPSLSLPPEPSPFEAHQEIRVNCAPSTGTAPFQFKWEFDQNDNFKYTIGIIFTYKYYRLLRKM